MTIEKGRAWGQPAGEVGAVAWADDDAALAAMVMDALADERHLLARVRRGDLLRTLGVMQERNDDELVAYPMDLGLARLGDDSGGSATDVLPFVAHAVTRRRDPVGRLLRHGPGITLSVMNAAWYGDLRLGPKAHPNDGLLDITAGQVPFRHRREALHRARSGSHLPHPSLTVSRRRSWEIEFLKPLAVLLDGVERGQAATLSVEVAPDAFTVIA